MMLQRALVICRYSHMTYLRLVNGIDFLKRHRKVSGKCSGDKKETTKKGKMTNCAVLLCFLGRKKTTAVSDPDIFE